MRRRRRDQPGAIVERESYMLQADSRVTMVTDSGWLPPEDDPLWKLGPEVVWLISEYLDAV